MNVFDPRKRLVDDHANYTRSFIKVASVITCADTIRATGKAANTQIQL
jgi:hypothetical protein